MEQSNDMESSYSDAVLTPEEQEELEEAQPLASAISFRNQDFDVLGLVNRLENQDILVPRIGTPSEDAKLYELNSFQRGFVWNKKQMDLFIESLLLEYPIPGLFFVQQSDRRYIVLDGQQRLETLRRYYSGFNNDKRYRLRLEGSRFDNLSYKELPDQYRRILDNTYITTTIILLDNTPESSTAVYDVFKRLNSGGTQLTPHEIRMALYNGALMGLIDSCNSRPSWRKLYGSERPNKRFRDHELILRIIALFLEEDKYSKPLGNFLNQFAEKYRNGDNESLKRSLALFDRVADELSECSDVRPFSMPGTKQLNTARADSIMVGCMRELDSGVSLTEERVRGLLDALDKNPDYEDSVTSATSDDTQVHRRIALVREALQ